jgi:tetratricopeptide (TPR) repeat protein
MVVNHEKQIKLQYRDEFRTVYGEAFQNWFERLAAALHGDDCFLPIRVTRGDGGLDGLVLRTGEVYQLHAPPTLGTDASTALKIKNDFDRAIETLGSAMKTWTFVHNSADNKVGHLTAKALLQLRDEHPTVHIDAIGINGLWERLTTLPVEKLATLFGYIKSPDPVELRIRALLKRSSDLDDQGRRREAFEATEEALAIAETERLVALQAEILVTLTLMSSQDRLGDRDHYFKKLWTLRDSITDTKVLMMFHRAHAAYLQDSHDTQGAESAYLDAIAVACSPTDAESCGGILCVARSEYVHLLCNAGRFSEAEEHLQLAEAYAKQHPDEHGGEVFQAALTAGLHWAATVADEDAAVLRIEALERSASTRHLAMSVCGKLLNVANGLSHSNCHLAALAAAEAALRLSKRIPAERQQVFQPGVLYTIAMIHFAAGRPEEALLKAKSLVTFRMSDTEAAPIRFAAAQLVSVILREIGDLATAVEKAELASDLAMEIDSSFMAKMNLSVSLADLGETERALQVAQEAHHLAEGSVNLPKSLQLEAVGTVAMYAAQLGKEDILERSMSKLIEGANCDEDFVAVRDRYTKLIEANREIRSRIIEISLVGQGPSVIREALDRVKEFPRFLSDLSKKGSPSTVDSINSLREANALTIAPVLEWWGDTGDDLNAAALDYDYWGRGCFAQILRNLQAFPHSLNVALEVRTVEDIKQAMRLWSLYADFVLLIWKGPTKSGEFLHMVDGEWLGPWGAGYILAPGTQLRSQKGRLRFPAIGYASWLPEDVMRCLVNEVKPFLMSGRLLVVPASGVGCVSPGHGVMEQLLTEAANCIPAIRQRHEGHLDIGLLPYARDIPMDILFDFINETDTDLLQMRMLMLRKTAHIRLNGLEPSPRILELEIAETLRRLRAQNGTLSRKRQLSTAEQETYLGIAPFNVSGHGRVDADEGIFSPLLTLESMGYGWKIGAPVPSYSPYRYQPTEDEAIGAWLAPPECGARIAMVTKIDDEADVT